MAFTRADTVNVGSQSVAISFNGTNVVVIPPQIQSAPTRPSFPSSSGGYTSISLSSSSFYDESAPLLSPMRYTRLCRAPITWQQAQDIRCLHSSSMDAMKASLKHRIPQVEYRGGSPIFSYHSSPRLIVPQTLVLQADDDVDEIYSGYRHITTLDLDDVANLSNLKSPTQSHGQENSDTSVQPSMDHACDLQFDEPAPPMSEVWIDPYALPPGSYAENLPVCNVSTHSSDYPLAFHTLVNSGLNFWTDYELSDSPRMCLFAISAALMRCPFWTHESCETIAIDQQLAWPQQLEKVNTRERLFVPFSYTSSWQPRTEHARMVEGEPRSPTSVSPGFGVLFEA
jgi:hypothetical protein